jgi:hypothetical protein
MTGVWHSHPAAVTACGETMRYSAANMRNRQAPLVAVLAVVVGCGGGAVGSPVDFSPPPSPVADPSIAASPSPAPVDPDASYESAHSTYVKAVEAAGPDCAMVADLTAQRRCFEASLAALGRFVSRLRSIAFPDDVAAQAQTLLAATVQLGELLADAREETDPARLVSHWWPQIDPIDVTVLEAARSLREAFGLPPIQVD